MRAVMSARRKNAKGQAMVELALSAFFLLLLLGGVAQVGAIALAQVNADNASRDGARIASVHPDQSGAYTAGTPGTSVVCPSNGVSTNPVCVALWNAYGGSAGVTATIVAPMAGNQTTCTMGDTADGYISVTTAIKSPIFMPFMAIFFADPGTYSRSMTSTTVMRVSPCSITNGT